MKVRREIVELLSGSLGRVSNWKHAIYKGTSCGAWIDAPDENTLRCGSIVEGTDSCVMPRTVTWPFDAKEFWSMVEDVNREACAIWDRTHGCEECAKLNGYGEGCDGETPVNSECTGCNGHGVII